MLKIFQITSVLLQFNITLNNCQLNAVNLICKRLRELMQFPSSGSWLSDERGRSSLAVLLPKLIRM